MEGSLGRSEKSFGSELTHGSGWLNNLRAEMTHHSLNNIMNNGEVKDYL